MLRSGIDGKDTDGSDGNRREHILCRLCYAFKCADWRFVLRTDSADARDQNGSRQDDPHQFSSYWDHRISEKLRLLSGMLRSSMALAAQLDRAVNMRSSHRMLDRCA